MVVVSIFLWAVSSTLFLIFGLVYFFLSILVPPKWLHLFAKAICRLFLLGAGQWLRLENTFPNPAKGPYIYVFNHTSLLDTFILVSVLPEFTGAIGKKEQFSIPLWGWILKRWGVVPIDRKALRDAIRSLQVVEKSLQHGLSLLISPEGTRSLDGTLQSFKKGAFHVALHTQTPIVPICIFGAHSSKNRSSWRLRPGTIRVKVARTIVPSQLDSCTVESLRAETRAVIGEVLSTE